jgi:hypothetical protein
MKKSPLAAIKLSENHRRSISITLQLVDKALCEWDDWTKGKLRVGVMYYQRDTFSPEQKNELRNKIDRIRQLMTQMRNDLQLKTGVIDTAHSMLGQAGVLWEMLAELNGRALQRGGKVPGELTHYLDPIGEQLAAEMNEIARLFSKPISDPIKS